MLLSNRLPAEQVFKCVLQDFNALKQQEVKFVLLHYVQ